MGIGVKLTKSSNQTITSAGTWTTVTFDGVAVHVGDTFWVSGTPSRFTIPSGKAGFYLVGGGSYCGSLGNIDFRFLKNGTTPIGRGGLDCNTTALNRGYNLPFLVSLEAGDYVELQAKSTSSSYTVQGGNFGAVLYAHYLGGGAQEDVGAFVTRTTNQSGANWTIASFDNEVYDTGAYWTAASPTKFSISASTAGTHIVGAQTTVDLTAGDRSWIEFLVNGGGQTGSQTGASLATNVTNFELLYATVLNLSAGDYVEARVYLRSGGTLISNTIGPAFWIRRLEAIT